MPLITMEDTMKKTHIDLVRITPDMDVEQILQKLTQHLLKQGWTITDDEAEERESNHEVMSPLSVLLPFFYYVPYLRRVFAFVLTLYVVPQEVFRYTLFWSLAPCSRLETISCYAGCGMSLTAAVQFLTNCGARLEHPC